MEKHRVKISSVFLLFLLTFASAPIQSGAQNTTLVIFIPNLNKRAEKVANLLRQNLQDLYISLKIVQQTQTNYLANIYAKGESKPWDIAYFSFDVLNRKYPEVYDRYSNTSSVGTLLYNMNETGTLEAASVNLSEFQGLIEQIHFEFDPTKRKELMDTFQRKMMEEWLIELPLLEQIQGYLLRKGFSGFDKSEGLLKSMFLGAYWENNPSERASSGGTPDVFQSFIRSEVGNMNPLAFAGKEMREAQEYLFASLFLVDKDSRLHPYLVKQYNFTLYDNQSSVWDLRLNENFTWRERNGSRVKVTTKDVKFTIDLLKSKWSSFVGAKVWDGVSKVEILDDHHMKLYIKRASPVDKFQIGNLRVVPEYLLNGTLHNANGDVLGDLYKDKINPTKSIEWSDFSVYPVTNGPYYFFEKRGTDYIFKFDDQFPFPSESDVDDFDLTTTSVETPYYFSFEDNPTSSTFEKPASLRITERRFIVSELQTTTILQFKSGIGDLLTLDQVDVFSSLQDDTKYEFSTVPVPGSGEMLIFNLHNDFLKEFDIRKAIYYGLDRELMSDLLGFDQKLLNSPINSFYGQYYNPSWAYSYDFQAAANLLSQHGYVVLGTNSQRNNFATLFSLLGVAVAAISFRKRRQS